MQRPNELGYTLPAEWEPHEATWLSWPKNPLTFPPETVDAVELIYVKMISALSRGEKVSLLIDDEPMESRVRALLPSLKNVQFCRIKSADVWMRDYGPIFVRNGKGDVAATKWKFNAWGKKYDDLLSDNDTGLEVARIASREVFTPDMVLEGGSIDCNGSRVMLTTEQCLLNQNRNPSLSRTEIQDNLREYLGVQEIIWLDAGIVGDDTDGHIDDIARFVGRNTVVCMVESDPTHDNYRPLKRNYELLKKYNESSLEKLKIVPIEMPKSVFLEENRLPASYANFYISNSAVLLPVFGDKDGDQRAVTKLGEVFPQKSIVPVECSALVGGFGGIHCVTQQQPG